MFITIILITVEVICSLALIGLILLQQSKSEGLGLAFGAGMGESLFGSRAGNILTKLTVIFAIVFMVNTVLLAMNYSGDHGATLMSRFARPAPAGAAQPVQPRPSMPQAGEAAPMMSSEPAPAAFEEPAPVDAAPVEAEPSPAPAQ